MVGKYITSCFTLSFTYLNKWFWLLEAVIYKLFILAREYITSSFNWFIALSPLLSSHNIYLYNTVVASSFFPVVLSYICLLLPAVPLIFRFSLSFSHSFCTSEKGLKFHSFKLILSMSCSVSGLILATP